MFETNGDGVVRFYIYLDFLFMDIIIAKRYFNVFFHSKYILSIVFVKCRIRTLVLLADRPHLYSLEEWTFKEPRNRFPAWRAGTTTLFDVPARQNPNSKH